MHIGFRHAVVGMLAAAILCAAAIPASAEQQGIDISHYDGAVDFAQVKASGQTFAYIKATEGEHTTDSWFARNNSSAKTADIAWGPYHFLRLYSVASAEAQAEHYWQTIKGTGYALRPVVDVETADGQQLATTVRAIIQAFCDRFKALSGENPVIYSYTSYINEYGLAKQFSGYLLWQAQYSSTRKDTGWDAQVWQYSDKGSVVGVTAPTVDLNVLYDTGVYESTAQTAKSSTQPPKTATVAYSGVYSTSKQTDNSRAGAPFAVLDSTGKTVPGRAVYAGDRLTILGVDYASQRTEIIYPTSGGYVHAYIQNSEANLHNSGYNKWHNGSTNEPVYNAAGQRIGTIYPHEYATALGRDADGRTHVLYSTGKGPETKDGYVRYRGR